MQVCVRSKACPHAWVSEFSIDQSTFVDSCQLFAMGLSSGEMALESNSPLLRGIVALYTAMGDCIALQVGVPIPYFLLRLVM
jgi:hypothetical protein